MEQPTLFETGPPAPAEWPRLTEDLRGDRRPDACQGCGEICDLARWQEHDEHDRPEHRVVVLCLRCSDRLVEKHPRLYRELSRNEPWPGCMAICVPCSSRRGTACTNAAAKANGGAGVELTIVKPSRIFLDGTAPGRGGKRTGWSWLSWPRPAEACEQRSTLSVLSPEPER